MLIEHDPDRYVPMVTQTICGYHKRNPGIPYPGCTCSTTFTTRETTTEEYRERRRKRLSARREALRRELASINAELGETP